MDIPTDSHDRDAAIADSWNVHRRRILDLSYRMLGTLSDAEEVLQETFARLSRHGVDGIGDVLGWLITTAGRICLDRLRADRTRREYVGPWLPEPLVELRNTSRSVDPADQVTLDDTVRMAMLVVLESLSPAERTVFVLHEAFAMTFEQIAEIVGRTPAACRQLASRARRHIATHPEPRFVTEATEARRVAERFAAACANGDLNALVAVLDPDVTGDFDSGGAIANAPLATQHGAPIVAMTLTYAFTGANAGFLVTDVNGTPGVIVELHGQVMAVIALQSRDDRIAVLHAIGNPAKLAHLNR